MDSTEQSSPNRRRFKIGFKRQKNEGEQSEEEKEEEQTQQQQPMSSPNKRRIIRRKNASTGTNAAAIDLDAKLEENTTTTISTTPLDASQEKTSNLSVKQEQETSVDTKTVTQVSNENDKSSSAHVPSLSSTSTTNSTVPSASSLNTKEAFLPLKLRKFQYKTNEPTTSTNGSTTTQQQQQQQQPIIVPTTVSSSITTNPAVEMKNSTAKVKPELIEEEEEGQNGTEEDEEDEDGETKIEFLGHDTKPIIRKRDGKNKARSFSYATNIKPSSSFRKKFPSIFFENIANQKAMIAITESKKNIFGEKNLHCIYRGVEYIEKGCSLYCASCRQCAPIKFVCENIMSSQNSCKKVICLKCVKAYGGKDLDTLVQKGGWLCFQCRDLPNPAKKGAAALLALTDGNNEKPSLEQSSSGTLNRAGKPMRSAASKTQANQKRNQNKSRRRSKIEEEEEEEEEEDEGQEEEEQQESSEDVKQENDDNMEDEEEENTLPVKLSAQLVDWSKNLIMDLIKL